MRLRRRPPHCRPPEYSLALCYNQRGEVSEWFMVPLSKSGVLATGPGVRIPPSPPGKDVSPLVYPIPRRLAAVFF